MKRFSLGLLRPAPRVPRRRLFHLLPLFLALAAAACAPGLEPAGPPVTAPRLEKDALVAADGARLPLRRWLPKGDGGGTAATPAAVVLALHGFNDYSKAWEAPAEYWAKADGIATYAYDQRGFGAAPHRGLWAGAATMAADAATAASLLRQRYPRAPLYVAGESMGGTVAMIAAADGGLAADGLVLLAPALRGRAYLGAVPRAALWLAAHTIPWYPVTGEGLHIQASDNIEMLRKLARDPLVLHSTRIDAVHGLVDAMDKALAAAPRIRLPVLVLYGARDELVPPKPVLDAVRRMPPAAHARVAVYKAGWHMLLRDREGRRVMKDVAAWIERPAAPLPSGADAAARKALAAAAE